MSVTGCPLILGTSLKDQYDFVKCRTIAYDLLDFTNFGAKSLNASQEVHSMHYFDVAKNFDTR